MKNKFIFIFLVALLSLTFVSAAQESLGTFRIREDVTLLQLCGDCTYNNITSVTYPNSTEFITNVVMSRDGTEFSYFLDGDNLTTLGEYNVNGFGDLNGNGENEVWSYTFEVTSSGFSTNQTIGFYFFILVIAGALITFGFKIEDNWVIIFGGFVLILFGLYILFYGIVGFIDPVYTWAIGLIVLMLGSYFSVRGGYESLYAK